jgi:arylsulfatase A-like enzyme
MVHEGSGSGARSWPGPSGFDSGELQVPKEYVDRVPSRVSDPSRRCFVAMVSLLDEAVGNVSLAYQRAGLWDSTIVVFASDNGAPFDARGQVGNLPLRGQKHTLWCDK